MVLRLVIFVDFAPLDEPATNNANALDERTGRFGDSRGYESRGHGVEAELGRCKILASGGGCRMFCWDVDVYTPPELVQDSHAHVHFARSEPEPRRPNVSKVTG